MVVGYAENYIIQGFNVLKPEQSVSVMRAFDLESEVFIEEITTDVFEEVLFNLEALEETETAITSSRRLEQGYLKKNLFGKRIIGSCACCKKEYPVSYLITAHIKKRAFCQPHEKRDLNVVMPMCRLGCDELFEKGYISVLDGLFVDMLKTPNSVELQNFINEVSGNTCEYYKEETQSYFEWHYDHHQ
ncbi:MAG: hypothetical protein DA405_11425 [Bacteroidetes bacterium]|nr:MAG: hypothetical protein DA405_11425 [Bacteroidota bacterium]